MFERLSLAASVNTMEVRLAPYVNAGFSKEQLEQICIGLQSGIDVSQYTDITMSIKDMISIREKLERELHTFNLVSYYFKAGFAFEQIEQLKTGLEEGIDIQWYSRPEYKVEQMIQIRLGLEAGLDVSFYACPMFTSGQMEQIRIGLVNGIDVTVYNDPNLSCFRMEEIRTNIMYNS